MAGRIVDDDIKKIRESTRLDDIVSSYVTLRNAGVGSLKGLCPFHDEKTPSFQVRPQVGLWHCFGCSEGGDAIAFIMKIEHLPFVQAVEWLADKIGITLRYTEGGPDPEAPNRRRRLLLAHEEAETFFAEQLLSPPARVARDFLRAKGFNGDAARAFGVGFAPESWDALSKHLAGKGFTAEEIVESGLALMGKRGGHYDRFRGRVLWPIRDITGGTIGFGARKLLDSDQGPKYMNTPETPIYRKSHVLYGLDLAKKHIASGQRVVVVEGYTDVMACHLAGEQSAVATCGTAFGVDHAKILRRMLMTDDVMSGEVVFTFDGDAAGKKAAIRAYDVDEQFLARTMVAVGPDGLDPCDVRVQHGDEAVRAMLDKRQPLYDFVVRSRMDRWDLDTIEGRAQALRDVAPVLHDIKGRVIQGEYIRQVAGMLGLPEHEVTQAAKSAKSSHEASRKVEARRNERERGQATGERGQEPPMPDEPPLGEPPPDPMDAGGAPPDDRRGGSSRRPAASRDDSPAAATERELLKVLVQAPYVARLPSVGELQPEMLQVDNHRQVLDALLAAGLDLVPQPGAAWIEDIREHTPEHLHKAIQWLGVSPLPTSGTDEANERYADGLVAAIMERHIVHQKASLMRELARVGDTSSQEFIDVSKRIAALDARRQLLRDA